MKVEVVFCMYFITLLNNLQMISSSKFKFMRESRELLKRSGTTPVHPCVRECIKGQTLTCKYKFLVEDSTSMDLACANCPFNQTDCNLPGCTPAGGIQRPIITVNRMTPGPEIQVCEGDTIVVDVVNILKSEGITIHWHGLHQVNTPFMDGTPYITQCPILPFNSFRYQFKALPHGTHMWHGHVGFQDCDGLYGKLIVRRQEPSTFRNLYDYDLPEHSIIIWHWYNWISQGILENVLHTNTSIKPFGILINGKGSFKEFKDSSNRKIFTPREVFHVKKGKRYLFRAALNSAIYCPVQVSVDNHTLEMVSTSTSNIKPLRVDSFMMNAGERFNFILMSNQSNDCYLMRFRAFGDCGDENGLHQEAFVCYDGRVPELKTEYSFTYDQGRRDGKLFNAVQVAATNYEKNELISVTDIRSSEENELDVKGTPMMTLYVKLDSKIYNDALYPGSWPQFNDITFDFPTKPMYPQKEELDDNDTCSEISAKTNHCVGTFCVCPYTHDLPLNALVELVLVDVSIERKQDHPIHLHGNNFYIVAIEAVGRNITFESIKEMNEQGKISKVLEGVPSKDTISVPNKGYAVIRFKTTNPGYWLFHCHVSNHMELGMAMVFKVGQHSDMVKTPKNFPRCGNWVYEPEIEPSNNHAGSYNGVSIIVTTIMIAAHFFLN
ncbi:hypothetical protein LSTR_LSTR008359 [Laodelphax striatellus]|uniref:Uncharacterized protein n=1 Tax=Laodelphax striatellus TaxID=195883 RepID=A0A482XST4_LAOST|nr:hypothetical protein LSTR_LSTR008359 [Laodelphax striatellus]